MEKLNKTKKFAKNERRDTGYFWRQHDLIIGKGHKRIQKMLVRGDEVFI